MNKIPAAVRTLTKALKKDEGYRRGWQANIAMAFQDEYRKQIKSGKRASRKDLHRISNKAATYFLSLLCMTEKDKKFEMLKDLYEQESK